MASRPLLSKFHICSHCFTFSSQSFPNGKGSTSRLATNTSLPRHCRQLLLECNFVRWVLWSSLDNWEATFPPFFVAFCWKKEPHHKVSYSEATKKTKAPLFEPCFRIARVLVLLYLGGQREAKSWLKVMTPLGQLQGDILTRVLHLFLPFMF